jgi:hypothetical protein
MRDAAKARELELQRQMDEETAGRRAAEHITGSERTAADQVGTARCKTTLNVVP